MGHLIRSMAITVTLWAVAAPSMAQSLNSTPLGSAVISRYVAPLPNVVGPVAPRRPASLIVLYGTFVGLQVLDLRTTFAATGRGAHEANPLLRTKNAVAVSAVKAASTAGTIYFTEKVWKKNRRAAVLVMVGINSGFAVVAAHNARVRR